MQPREATQRSVLMRVIAGRRTQALVVRFAPAPRPARHLAGLQLTPIDIEDIDGLNLLSAGFYELRTGWHGQVFPVYVTDDQIGPSARAWVVESVSTERRVRQVRSTFVDALRQD